MKWDGEENGMGKGEMGGEDGNEKRLKCFSVRLEDEAKLHATTMIWLHKLTISSSQYTTTPYLNCLTNIS